MSSNEIEYVIIELSKFDPNYYQKEEEKMLKYWQIFLILIINSNNNDFFTNKMENFRILNKAVQIFKTSDNENETEDNTKIKDNSNPYW